MNVVSTSYFLVEFGLNLFSGVNLLWFAFISGSSGGFSITSGSRGQGSGLLPGRVSEY